MILIDTTDINRLNSAELMKYKLLTFFMSLILSLSSVTCLLLPLYSNESIKYFIGLAFIVCSATFLTVLFVIKRDFFSFSSSLTFGLIYFVMGYGIIVGIDIVMNTFNIAEVLLILTGGVCRTAAGIRNAKMNGRSWCFFIGFLDFIFAFMLSGFIHNTSFVIVYLFMGMEMIFSAWFMFITTYAITLKINK
ncbi:hypothetical protein U3C44_23105 (plasmid) [Enterobacter asburiae]|jgi:uncharacterized membrane protein HdeD (DUF308 family)|uniref:hypothetical protein n=1 Tax=Enterobacter asburiae TaxID=61645 RepID=UPI002932739F|nr:hypothetical protein [Enterobacter asburiae]